MNVFSEIRRVTKPGGWFFATLLNYGQVKYSKKRKRYYQEVKVNNKVIKSWMKQDKTQPHLFYFLSKNWEYMVPHYFMARDELKAILNQFFTDVKIKTVRKYDKDLFWYVQGRV